MTPQMSQGLICPPLYKTYEKGEYRVRRYLSFIYGPYSRYTMNLQSLPLPDFFKQHYVHFQNLTPIQEKAVQARLLEKKSLLICAPTASGKTLVASMAIANILGTGKVIYLVPLKALASEKGKEYQLL